MLNYTLGNVINKITNKDSKPVLSVQCDNHMWLLSTEKVVVPHVQMAIIWGILG